MWVSRQQKPGHQVVLDPVQVMTAWISLWMTVISQLEQKKAQ